MSEGRRARKQERKARVRAREEEAREARRGNNCYCGPDDDFCGECQVCGRPGHLRHFPGAVPYTGAWCDWHYWRLKVLHPNGAIGCWLYLGLALAVGVALVRAVF